MTTFTTEDRLAASPNYPKVGSKWVGSEGKQYHVMAVVELEGHVWVHYEQDKVTVPKEFSCYVESFLQRFTEIAE